MVTFRRDGTDEVRFECATDQVITDAADSAGIQPRVVCGRGGCGACRAVVVEGSIAHRGPVSRKRTRGTYPGHPGFVLLCRAVPRADVVVAPDRNWTVRPVHPWADYGLLAADGEITDEDGDGRWL
ncbi:2Fe-2S iron-sulfur cluster-binding protein [Rhodococcus ruber]|uniref:2Fe-2S iron-sulfur cluster-binding protein n=1 Tax=Rhodococcus ruber TaxID=1830 RepID=UPI003CCB380E